MDRRQFSGRDVFVVDAHHEVLAAWSDVRARLGFPPHLVSFDSRTDSHRAFIRHLGLSWDSPESVQSGEPLVRKVRFDDPTSISHAIGKLAHDEHIDCAHRAGIVDRVFIFLGAGPDGVHLPETRVFFDHCLPTCTKMPHDDECFRLLADNVLEPVLLLPRIEVVNADLGAPLEDVAYIMDIDLDVFRTRRAATTDDPSLFRRLLHHATAITIAREPGCVEDLRLEGEDITSDELEALMLDHIQRA
jgi:hypothetical protein